VGFWELSVAMCPTKLSENRPREAWEEWQEGVKKRKKNDVRLLMRTDFRVGRKSGEVLNMKTRRPQPEGEERIKRSVGKNVQGAAKKRGVLG